VGQWFIDDELKFIPEKVMNAPFGIKMKMDILRWIDTGRQQMKFENGASAHLICILAVQRAVPRGKSDRNQRRINHSGKQNWPATSEK
jgi:hypothetical protein